MNSVFTWSLYGTAVILLAVSFYKDKQKTAMSLKRAWKMFISVLPQFVAILLLTGLFLAGLKPDTIRSLIGTESGLTGMLVTSLVGAIAFVPVIIAFPVTAELLANGAGIVQMAVFVTTLTTVGFITLPIEVKYLGKKIAWMRNSLAFGFAFTTALLMGVLL